MYMPVNYVPASAPAAGLGDFRRMSARLQEAEFYPPPYNTDSPIDLSDIYGVAAAGLGNYGMGLFDSLDPTTWGIAEWGALAAAGYLGLKLFGDVRRGTKTVRKASARRSAKRAKKKRLKEELASL